MNDHATTRGPLCKITMRPGARGFREVRLVVFFIVRVVPKTHRHGWEREPTDQLALARLQMAQRAQVRIPEVIDVDVVS